MSDGKCIGLEVHKTSISAAVLDVDGKLVMQSIFPTPAAAILSLLHGVRGTLRSRLKNAPIPAGSMICSARTLTKCWCAIQGKMHC